MFSSSAQILPFLGNLPLFSHFCKERSNLFYVAPCVSCISLVAFVIFCMISDSLPSKTVSSPVTQHSTMHTVTRALFIEFLPCSEDYSKHFSSMTPFQVFNHFFLGGSWERFAQTHRACKSQTPNLLTLIPSYPTFLQVQAFNLHGLWPLASQT